MLADFLGGDLDVARLGSLLGLGFGFGLGLG